MTEMKGTGLALGLIRVRGHLAAVVILCLVVVLIGPTAGIEPLARVSAAAMAMATPAAGDATGSGAPCTSGRMKVGDLPAIDPLWPAGLAAATKTAKAWQPDARLIEFQVLCQVFGSGFLWRGTYYSPSAQLLFVSDSGATRLTNADPSSMSELKMDGVSFTRLHDTLVRAGYPDSAELTSVSGVDVQMSTDQRPFGPPGAPRDTVYFHVAVELNGQVQDLFVSASDLKIYRYQAVSELERRGAFA